METVGVARVATAWQRVAVAMAAAATATAAAETVGAARAAAARVRVAAARARGITPWVAKCQQNKKRGRLLWALRC